MKIFILFLLLLYPAESIAQFRGHTFGTPLADVVAKEKNCTRVIGEDYGASDEVYLCTGVTYKGFPCDVILTGLHGSFEGGWLRIRKDKESWNFRVRPGYLLVDELREKYGNPKRYIDLRKLLDSVEAVWVTQWGLIYLTAKAGEQYIYALYLSTTLVAEEKKRKARKQPLSK